MSGKMRTAPAPRTNTKGPVAQRMTAQQELFVEALTKNNFNGKAAAISAGIAEKNAGVQACLWLNQDKYPHIQRAIQAKMEERRNTSEVDAKRIIQELSRIAFFNPKELLGPDGKKPLTLAEMPDAVAAALGNISVTYGEEQDGDGNYHVLKHIRYTPHDKLKALSQLASMLGFDNGEALKVINNVQLNQLVVNWDKLYKRAATDIKALTTNDPIEQRISAENGENAYRTKANAEDTQTSAPDTAKPLKVVESND